MDACMDMSLMFSFDQIEPSQEVSDHDSHTLGLKWVRIADICSSKVRRHASLFCHLPTLTNHGNWCQRRVRQSQQFLPGTPVCVRPGRALSLVASSYAPYRMRPGMRCTSFSSKNRKPKCGVRGCDGPLTALWQWRRGNNISQWPFYIYGACFQSAGPAIGLGPFQAPRFCAFQAKRKQPLPRSCTRAKLQGALL